MLVLIEEVGEIMDGLTSTLALTDLLVSKAGGGRSSSSSSEEAMVRIGEGFIWLKMKGMITN